MGFLPGTEVKIRLIAPFGDPIAVNVADYCLSIRKRDAKNVLLEEQTKALADLTVALIGNPNSGKTTIFNLLTGLTQKTGNFPGVTVDKKSGSFKLGDGRKVELVDLPGCYSIYPKSLDEQVVQ